MGRADIFRPDLVQIPLDRVSQVAGPLILHFFFGFDISFRGFTEVVSFPIQVKGTWLVGHRHKELCFLGLGDVFDLVDSFHKFHLLFLRCYRIGLVSHLYGSIVSPNCFKLHLPLNFFFELLDFQP